MRSLVLSSWLSLDGYSCDPGTEIYRLLEEIGDPEQEDYFVGRLRGAGTHIMGRVTYEGMAKAWPGSGHPVAAPMNEIPKVVFSSTLASADWAGQ
jgi:dihydrofolate reductase